MQTSVILNDGTRLTATPASRVAITKQANDITKVDSVQATYSTTFTLPDTLEVKQALEQAHLGTSATRLPYGSLGGSLEVRGLEVLPRASIQVQGYQPGVGFEAQAFGGTQGFYQALGDKKLSALALPGQHTWSAQNVAAGLASTGWQDYYCYDVLDRGRLIPERADPTSGTGTPFNIFEGELYPTVYVRAVWEQIFTDAGYKWAGPMPAEFDRLTLPAVGAFGYSDDTRAANSVHAGWQHQSNNRISKGGEFEIVPFPFNYSGPLEPWAGGAGVTYSGPGYRTVTTLGYYRLSAALKVQLGSTVGKVGTKIEIWAQTPGGTKSILATDQYTTRAFDTEETIEATNVRVLLAAGTKLWVRFEGSQESGALAGEFWRVGHTTSPIFNPGAPVTTFVEPEDTAYFDIELLADFPHGGQINLQDWVPDLTQKELIKAVVQKFGLTQEPHPYLNLMTFTPTGPALQASLATAPAWDERIDTSKGYPVKYQVGSFGQLNTFSWKPDPANGAEYALLGQGQVPCQDTTLDAVKDLLTLPFAASPRGQDGLPLVPKWKLKPGYSVGNTDPANYTELTPLPRLLLRSSSRTRRITIQDDTSVVTVEARLSYFDEPAEAISLSWGRYLLPTYYQHLIAALRAPRLLKPYVRLSPTEGLEFTQLQAIWLEREGAYFYCNKLDQYEPSQPSTAAELIRLTY